MRERRRHTTLTADSEKFEPEIRFDPENGHRDESHNWTEVFGREAPLALEIGTGNGAFMAAEAARHREMNFIGVERSNEFFDKFRKRVIREGLTNVRCIHADVNDVFSPMMNPGGLARVICNFSDPWPKRRHRDRRVFRPEFLELLEWGLRNGGDLIFKSDVGWYFNFTVNLLRRRAGWRLAEAGPVPDPREEEGEITTNFQRKAREAGRACWGFTAVWEGAGVRPSNDILIRKSAAQGARSCPS